MNRYTQSLPMPTRRKQLGRHGRGRLVAALKFLGEVLVLGAIGYLFFVLVFSL